MPRGRSRGDGPNDFQVNRTAAAAAVTLGDAGPAWRLTLIGPSGRTQPERAALESMPQHTAELPIACVEGWSTTQTWSGVRLADLAALAGMPGSARATVRSLERAGAFNRAVLAANQVGDPDSLLALRVNGADLSLDHGYPARIIVPALPGCTTPNGCAPSSSEHPEMGALARRFTACYGADPLHLLGTVAASALAGYAVTVLGPEALWNPRVWWQSIGVWFLAAVIAHDLVLFPLYALADRSLVRALSALRGRRTTGMPGCPR